ncbi:MAG: hypothetical protein J6W81_10520 [Lentisphaeria bacterium]|nr:hypothetical protein [Lentisphaeria bacterium]
MDLHDFCIEMGFDLQTEELFKPHWERLCNNTVSGIPSFMTREFFDKWYPRCKGPAGLDQEVDEVLRIVENDPVCARYAAMLHYAYFIATPYIGIIPPLSEKKFGKNAGIFHLFIVMSSLPLIEKTHQNLRLPEKYFLDTCTWIGGTISIYAAAHEGYPGHTPSQTYWMRFHIDGKLFRVGRFEYMMEPFSPALPAIFRNRKDNSLAVLCRDQWAFDGNGFRVDPDKETPAFTARLKFLDNRVTGTPVTPYGFPQTGRKVTLDLTEWEAICSPWDTCLGIHIPGGGGMTEQAVRDSLLEARQFFRKYFSVDIKVFQCSSWLFNPAWEKELPDSNLALLQRNVYLTPPLPLWGCPGFFFVYGRPNGDPRQFQCTTSLHKAFCRIAERGEPLRNGAMFILASDLESFGKNTYRNSNIF